MISHLSVSTATVVEGRLVFFSIVMPLYNKELSVSRAVHSVLGQSHSDFELLIVDDGSTDNSLEVARRFQDPRIRVLTKVNGGASSARNLAIENASGEFVAFLDADDEWRADFLEKMVRLIDVYPQAVLYSSAYMNVEAGKDNKLVRFSDTGDHFEVGCLANYFSGILQMGASINNSSTSVVRLQQFRDGLSFPTNIRTYEDHAVWYRLALKGEVAYIPEGLSCIHKDSENRSAGSWRPSAALRDLVELTSLVSAYGKRFVFDEKKLKQYEKLIAYRMGYLARASLRMESFVDYLASTTKAPVGFPYSIGRVRAGYWTLRLSLYVVDSIKSIVRLVRNKSRGLPKQPGLYG